MADALKNLQQLQFKGFNLPYTSASIGFAHASSEKAFTFKDEQLIQRLGRKNQTFRYTIPYFDGLRMYGNLFSETFKDFYNACLSREPGVLVDPIRGEIRAVVASLQVQTSPGEARDGVTVEIDFVESPESLSEDAPEFSLQSKALQAEKARAFAAVEFEDIDISKYDGLQNPIQAITNALDSVSLQRDRALSQLDREVQKVDSLAASIEETSDPNKWSPLDQLANYKQALIRTNRAVFTAGATVLVLTLSAPKTVFVILRRPILITFPTMIEE